MPSTAFPESFSSRAGKQNGCLLALRYAVCRPACRVFHATKCFVSCPAEELFTMQHVFMLHSHPVPGNTISGDQNILLAHFLGGCKKSMEGGDHVGTSQIYRCYVVQAGW